MSLNPFQSPNSDSPLLSRAGGSPKVYVYGSVVTAILFMAVSALFWYVLGATYTDGQIMVDDPAVSFSTDINGNPYASYDTFYLINVAGFIGLHLLLLMFLLLVVNVAVWIIRLFRSSRKGVGGH